MKPSYHYGKSTERGYVLIATVGILMGLMAIVLSLARISSQAKNDFDQDLLASQARFAIETANAYPQAILSQQNPWDMSRLQRNWVLPGTWSMPYKLQLNLPVNTSATSITVNDLKPLFMAMATCRDGGKKKVTLSTAMTISETAATLNSGYSNIVRTNSYYIIENELVRGTSTPTTITIAARGLAGVLSAHPAGSPVYFYDSTLTGFIQMNNEWMLVSGGPATPDFSVNTITVTRGYRNTTPSSAVAGQYVYFFPFDPMLDVGGTIGQIQIDLSNEQSRINLNGLTSNASSNLFGNASLYTAINNSPNFPLRNLYTAASLVPSTQSALNSNENSFTLFSEPDPNRAIAMLGASPLFIDNQVASSGRNVIIHAVNVNEANVDVLTKVFTMMGINANNSIAYAKSICEYRSGEDSTYKIKNYFNGANPFDGKNTVSGTYYPSPAEEFRAFLQTNALADIQLIMKHVLGEAHDLQAELTIGPMLCFEAGDVWRIQSAVSLGDKKAPKIFKKSEMVAKNNPEPYSDSGTIGSGVITLDSSNGWNENYSTFFGVTARSTIVEPHLLLYGTMPFYKCVPPSWDSNYYQLGQGMSGNLNGAMITLGSRVNYNIGTTTTTSDNSFLITAGTLASAGNVDFGLRCIVSPSLIFKNSPQAYDSANVTVWLNPSTTGLIAGNGFVSGNRLLYLDATNFFSANIIQIFGDNVKVSDNIGTFPINASLAITGPHDYGVTNPIYETVIVKEGATFSSISWKDRPSGGVTCDVVEGENCVPANSITNGQTIGLGQNYIRLRFNFPANTAGLRPQLFSVKVSYTTDPLAPKTIVYDRK